MRSGLSQRAVAEKSGISLRALREIEQGRVRSPRMSSLRRLAEVLDSADFPARILDTTVSRDVRCTEHQPMVLRVLGRLSAFCGSVELPTGTPKQQNLLALLALRANQVVERDEIVEILWGDEIPDSFGQLIHTYVYRIRLLLDAHAAAPDDAMTLTRRATGYTLRVADTGRLDLLEFLRLTQEAQRARTANDSMAELSLLDELLSLWAGPVLDGMLPGLRTHPVAVESSQARVACALRFADLGLELGMYEEVIERVGPIERGNPLHEGVHARLILALAGSGQRAAALEAFAAVDKRLRNRSGIGPGAELRTVQLSILRADRESDRDTARRIVRQSPVQGSLALHAADQVATARLDPNGPDGSAEELLPIGQIAAAIRLERGRRGISLSDLAGMVGMAASDLTQLESGSRIPSLETLWALSIALEAPLSRLFEPQ